jgi:hypothetical protein
MYVEKSDIKTNILIILLKYGVYFPKNEQKKCKNADFTIQMYHTGILLSKIWVYLFKFFYKKLLKNLDIFGKKWYL